MATLDELLASHKDELLQRWELRVRQRVSPRLSTTELGGHVPQLIAELIASLRQQRRLRTTRPPLDQSSTPADHGGHRFAQGFDIAQVINEYGALRECIADLAGAHRVEVTAEEQRVMASTLYDAAARAAAEYARHRDEELRAQNARHLGFLAHELRNPITSARLALDLLRLHPDRADRAAAVIHSSLETLRDLVDNALTSARLIGLGAGVELKRERIAITELVDEVVREAAVDADARTVSLRIETADAVPPLDVDRRVLRSAVSNLVRNGIKFTHHGGRVLIRVDRVDGAVVLHIDDECGGLASPVEELFEVYVQKGKERSGFGLGLAIAREAVRAHGGDVTCTNRPAIGCRFVITLPVVSSAPMNARR